MMRCMVANFCWKALCHSYDVAFHYGEIGGCKFRLGFRKNKERMKYEEKRKSENSSLTVCLPISVVYTEIKRDLLLSLHLMTPTM